MRGFVRIQTRLVRHHSAPALGAPMNTSFARGFRSALSLAVVLASTGCVPSLTHITVIYNKETNWAPVAALEGNGHPSEGVPCHGSVEVNRDHGIFYLIGPDGPWWQHQSGYGIYFKQGPDVPGEFYLLVSPDRNPVQTSGVRGKVVVEGRHVIIDVAYKDSQGRWRNPPINGRRKIDLVFPDDRPRARSSR